MKLITISGLILLISISMTGLSQEVQNLRVSQSGNRVNILFDLNGVGKVSKLDLFYTMDDGKTWTGPLKNIIGEIRNMTSPSTNNQIIWDAQSEKGIITGNVQFRIEIDLIQPEEKKITDGNIEFKRHKTAKNIWLTATLISAGTGLYATSRGNKLYKEYETAGEDAADLHRKIETLDLIAPIAYGAAGISALCFIIQAGKQAKSKKLLSIHPMYLKDGGGATLTFKF